MPHGVLGPYTGLAHCWGGPRPRPSSTKVDQLLALCDTLESKLRDAEQGAQRLAEAMVAEMVA